MEPILLILWPLLIIIVVNVITYVTTYCYYICCNFGDFVSEIYPPELKLKNTTVCQTETSYLDTKINIGKGTDGIKTSIYHKRGDFNFKIVNFPYLDSNIPNNPAYGIYISQLVGYVRICSDKREFKAWNKRLSTKSEKQGYKQKILEKIFVKFYRSHYTKRCGSMKHHAVKELREPWIVWKLLTHCIFFF